MSEILKEIKQWCKAIGDEQHRKKVLHEDDLTTDLGSAAREARGHFCDYRMTQDA